MNDDTGFFPERRVLALRRQQQMPIAAPVSPGSANRVVWFVLAATFFPTVVTLITTSGPLMRPPVLMGACGALAVLALAGIVFGAYRGLTGPQRLARS